MDYLHIMEQHGFELVIPDKINTKYVIYLEKTIWAIIMVSSLMLLTNYLKSIVPMQFRDYYSEALDMRRNKQNKIYDVLNPLKISFTSVNNNPLIRLSSFNNYFIFKNYNLYSILWMICYDQSGGSYCFQYKDKLNKLLENIIVDIYVLIKRFWKAYKCAGQLTEER